MTSADFSQQALLRISDFSYFTSMRSPQVRTITFIPCNRLIYCIEFGQHWTSSCVADLSTLIQPFIRFLFVGSELCPLSIFRNSIWLPSDSTSRWTPLPSANASCYRARSGLSPPSYRPCWAHNKYALGINSLRRIFIYSAYNN